MTSTRHMICLVLGSLALCGWLARPAAGQAATPAAPDVPSQVGSETQEPAAAEAPRVRRFPRSVYRFGQDLDIDADAEVREVIVALGNLTIDGHGTRDVYVWLGDVRLAPTAVVDGSMIVVAGNLDVERGAIIERDLAVLGGTLDAPVDFSPGGESALVGMPALGRGVRGAVPWVLRGLLLGRPIVPGLSWVWTVVGVFFALSLALTLIFGQAVRASADVVVARPLRVFLTGVLVLIVIGPILVILAATVVGLVVVPVVLFAFLVAWTLGKVGVARGVGHRMVHETNADSRIQALRSVTIGFIAITLTYVVPVLGLVVWSLVGVFGLGAATTAVMASLRKEYPPRRKPRADDTAPGEPADDQADVSPAAPPSESAAFAESTPPPTPPAGSGGTPPPRAGLLAAPRGAFLDRTAAFALDCVLVAILTRLLDSRHDGMFFLLLVGYHVAFWTWQGTTVGGIIIGLRVIRTNGEPLRFVDALVRGLSSVFSLAALGIGALWLIQDPERQAWHDKIAGTYVVKVPRDTPLLHASSA